MLRFVIFFVILICIISAAVHAFSSRPSSSSTAASFVSIRGNELGQKLPASLCKSWPTWTFNSETQTLLAVEGEGEEGWVNPNSFGELYLPSDLPLPNCAPALGVVISNGTPRFIMPSLVLSLETPERVWRNRGACSLPRARAWIDVFGMYASPVVKALEMSCFGKMSSDVRFLEDIDGAAAWTCLFKTAANGPKGLLRPPGFEGKAIKVGQFFEDFKLALKQNDEIRNALCEGYHYVDIVLPMPNNNNTPLRLPKQGVKMYLSAFDDPQRLLEIEDPSDLDGEPVGELVFDLVAVGAGSKSEFLPECYSDLYAEGNILMA